MTDDRSTMPRDEMTATLIGAAFGECIKVMKERGLDGNAVTSEFLSTGVTGLWTDEDREGLRAKAYAAVSMCVDGLFDSIGQPREPSPYPYLDDPTFHARAHALIAKEERSFQAWLATDGFDTLIEEAIKAGRNAYVNAPDDDSKPRSWAVIDLGHRRAKPLVMALQKRGIGTLRAGDLSYRVQPEQVIGKIIHGHSGPNLAAIEAFALALSRPGFEIAIWHDKTPEAIAA